MTRTRLRSLVPLLGLTAGAGLILAAVFATQLGLDRNADWGPSRWFMVEAGIVLAFVSLLFLLWQPIGHLLRSNVARIRGSRPVSALNGARESLASWWEASLLSRPRLIALRRTASRGLARLRAIPPVAWLLASSYRMAALGTILVSAAVLVIYLWIVSVGRWSDWPKTTDYYDQLATALMHGQLHLMVNPDSRLLDLSDPYQLESRETVNYLWDMVLYNGRYFLYWGPVPAVLLVPAKWVIAVDPGDQVLVFIGVSAAYLAGALLCLTLWRRFFASLPWWSAVIPLSVLGLANPMPWLLNRPEVYEVAIGAGQAFLLLGIYFALTALYRTAPARWRLAAAGVCWAAAVGSRASLAVVVIFLAGAAALGTALLRPARPRLDLRSLTALFLPLVLGAALLAGYNTARFGSPLEFGHRYQLGRWNKNVQYEKVFSPAYLAPNLYNYLFNRYRTLPVFPFVKPTWGTHVIVPLHMTAPEPYHTEQITGLLLTTPFALYALASPILAWRARRRRYLPDDPPSDDAPAFEQNALLWTHVILAGGVIFSFAPLMAFVSVTQRHLADIVPLLVILASVGFWLAHQALANHRGTRHFHLLVALTLMAYSAVIGLLLAITGYQARFEHLNPVLFEQITRLLAW